MCAFAYTRTRRTATVRAAAGAHSASMDMMHDVPPTPDHEPPTPEPPNPQPPMEPPQPEPAPAPISDPPAPEAPSPVREPGREPPMR